MIVRNVPISRYNRGKVEFPQDPVICEQWLELYLNNEHLMGTPVIEREIKELVYGYISMEGYIKPGERITLTKKPSGYFAEIPRILKIQSVKELVDCAYSKIVFKEKIDPLTVKKSYSADFILDLMREFQKLPSVYHKTGGVHMSAVAEEDGIIFWADDISRRNAFDKVLGKLFLADRSCPYGIVLSSGRVSSDIIVRLIRSKIPIIASVSAPTVKALELANSYGITVCGFVRGRRMNIYTHPQRIVLEKHNEN